VKVQRGMAFSKGEARAHGLEWLRMRSMGRRESDASPMSVKLPLQDNVLRFFRGRRGRFGC